MSSVTVHTSATPRDVPVTPSADVRYANHFEDGTITYTVKVK